MAPESVSADSFFAYQKALLTQELEYIRAQISQSDTLSFQIKGWTVTIWAAIVAFGSNQQVTVVVLASVPGVVTFWVLDALFKQYQRRLMCRLGAIEAFIDSDWMFKDHGLREAFQQQEFGSFPIHDPVCRRTIKLHPELAEYYEERTRFRSAFFVPNIAYFYILLLLSSVVIGFSLRL